MTEHSKIPLPGNEPEKKDGSLFERASGVFGLGGFKPAPVPSKLDEPPMKRAKVRKQPDAKVKEKVEAEVQVPQVAEEPQAETLPAPTAPSDVTVQQGFEPVEFGGPELKVDRQRLAEQGMIVPGGEVTALIEEFRIVKRQILATARDLGTAASRRVLICSPHSGEGKTFCSVNLALAMASERNSETLLVDADFAKPSILSTLGLPKAPGFMDCLADPELNPEDLVLATDVPGLWVLPAGNLTNTDSEYLASARTAEVLDRLTVGAPHRMVIFDSPPALAASPAAELAKHVGQAVLVARADQTGQNALEDAYQLLSACPDIKLLLNATNFSPSGRQFGSYYGYGE